MYKFIRDESNAMTPTPTANPTRLAEIRQIARDNPDKYTAAMEAEHTQLIEGEMASVRKPSLSAAEREAGAAWLADLRAYRTQDAWYDGTPDVLSHELKLIEAGV